MFAPFANENVVSYLIFNMFVIYSMSYINAIVVLTKLHTYLVVFNFINTYSQMSAKQKKKIQNRTVSSAHVE